MPWGSWLACTAAATSAGEAPETPIFNAAVELLPAKDSPSTADMSSGAARQPISTDRSRSRRRSSFSARTRINPAALSRSDSGRRPRGWASAPRRPSARRRAAPATATTAGRTAGPWSVRQLEVALDLARRRRRSRAHGRRRPARRGSSGVAGQVHLVPPAVLADQPVGRPLRDEVAVVDDADAVAQLRGLLHVVGRVEHGDAQAGRRSRGWRCGSADRRRRWARRARAAWAGAAGRRPCWPAASCRPNRCRCGLSLGRPDRPARASRRCGPRGPCPRARRAGRRR